jgi:hypothetical protein
MSADQRRFLRRQVVLFVGRSRRDGILSALGSGFIIGHHKSSGLAIVTAAHVLHGFVSQALRIQPTAFSGIPDDGTEAQQRLGRLLSEQLITVLIDTDDGIQEYRITQAVFGTDDRKNDGALIFAVPRDPNIKGPIHAKAMVIDKERIHSDVPIAMAGYGEKEPGSWKADIGDLDTAKGWMESLVVRAGRLAEMTNSGEGSTGKQWLMRTLIPTLGKMSGGPAFEVRYPKGKRPTIIGSLVPEVITAVGIISRGNDGGNVLVHSHSNQGETWATPLGNLCGGIEPADLGRPHLMRLVAEKSVIEYKDVHEQVKTFRP